MLFSLYYSEAGLSSNMEHKFCVNYTENTLPVEDKGSLRVRPIPKEENIMTRPMVSVHPCSNAQIFLMKSESQPEFAEHHNTLAVAQKMAFPPQAALPVLEEETINTLPGTTTITDKPDVEISEDNRIVNTNMDTRGNSAEPKGPPPVHEKRRNSSHLRKRPDGKKWKCNYILIYIDLK